MDNRRIALPPACNKKSHSTVQLLQIHNFKYTYRSRSSSTWIKLHVCNVVLTFRTVDGFKVWPSKWQVHALSKTFLWCFSLLRWPWCLILEEILQKSYTVTNEMKATEQYFAAVQFVLTYKVEPCITFCGWNSKVWPFKRKLYYCAVLSCSTVYYAVQSGSNFWVCNWNPKVWPFKWKLLSTTSLFILLYKVLLGLSLCMKSWSVTIQMKAVLSNRWCYY